MKDLVESQMKNEYDKGNVPPKRYIVTEAPRISTDSRRHPSISAGHDVSGTEFHPFWSSD